jgi:hypothetical protein
VKRLKQQFAALILVFVLASTAWAGEGVIYPWIIPPPPPPPPPSTPSTSSAIRPNSADSGEEFKSGELTVDLMTETTLSVLQNLLALF